MTGTPPTILKWTRFQLADLNEKGRITHIELYHTVDNEPAERLQVFSLKEAEDPNDISAYIWEVAENDATSRPLGDSQRYVLWAYRGEDSPNPEASHPFMIHGRGTHKRPEMSGGESSEPPNERGHMAQMMRQNSEMHRQMMIMADQIGGRLSAELDAERKRREAGENRIIQIFELHQNLMDRTAQRDLENAKEVSSERRMDEMVGLFKSIGPNLVVKLLGQEKLLEGMPSSTAALRGTAVGRLLANLSSAELIGISQALNNTHRLVFMEMWKTFTEGKIEGWTAETMDEGIKNFLSDLSGEEANGVIAAFTNRENQEVFVGLYKSYGRTHQEEQEKKPIPFRRP